MSQNFLKGGKLARLRKDREDKQDVSVTNEDDFLKFGRGDPLTDVTPPHTVVIFVFTFLTMVHFHIKSLTESKNFS